MFIINHSLFKIAILTGLALIAFAANSVLCRLALGHEAIDASSFTAIRLLSGAVVLFLIVLTTQKNTDSPTQGARPKGSWTASLMLFLYAVTFSYAYISLDTGTGALILFGAVQITMILHSLVSGTRLHVMEWLGITTAFAGFVYLILPGVTAPSLSGFLLMATSGVAWGIYTLKGRASKNPLLDTAYNFFRSVPLVIILTLITIRHTGYSSAGIWLAIISGGITSGIGYTLWYIALSGLSSIQAAVLQLAVPVIATFGGVIFVSEVITSRLIMSAILVLGGILMVILGRYYFIKHKA
ncbi:DMT family transporter [Vibrio gazogenes]|uniref:Threonine/homoserine efflux transporter RhtA n=1 Tax=Vibrio gazogenes DSM 21264 = NBRC 103151 TaxID=1123492 RepID=A0A1M4UZ41_VIBGA|nr:DMT family transporter [Vibrio gazogenes]USP15649.1 DMT family transporter [Vibrio gazogenes]SHE61996.1 Threonine/homoserine efflux transporter RhtA [Vibrio gazogenes DSM 21264] [Vibrio gazogenes DSM 21264 = NBRC 103151]SJN58103.1 EamA-like transporter family protein [Vibrio gazogenes]